MVRLTTYCLLAVLVAPALNLPTPGYTEETRLLHSIGLGHLAHKFDPAHGRSFLHHTPPLPPHPPPTIFPWGSSWSGSLPTPPWRRCQESRTFSSNWRMKPRGEEARKTQERKRLRRGGLRWEEEKRRCKQEGGGGGAD